MLMGLSTQPKKRNRLLFLLVQVLSVTPHLRFLSHDGINGTKSNGAGNNSLGSWSNMEIIHNARTHGMNSLMRDASAFDFEENIRLTKGCRFLPSAGYSGRGGIRACR